MSRNPVAKEIDGILHRNVPDSQRLVDLIGVYERSSDKRAVAEQLATRLVFDRALSASRNAASIPASGVSL